MFEEIKATLHEFRTDFDVYFHENSLHESGAVDKAVDRLKQSGHLVHRDGAWWLLSTEFGDDKDRVVIKSDGQPAYIAADLAYFLDKRARGFDLCIYMLGADHHGYTARLKAAAAALGDDPASVEVLIGQMVNLVRGGQPLRMSKRAGTVITLDDLIEALGVDAARFALIRYSVDTTLDLDLDVWTSTSNDNPVFYVQYAHARLCTCWPTPPIWASHSLADYDPDAVRTRRRNPHCWRCWPAIQGYWPPPPICVSRTGWPAIWRTWPRPTTSSTTSPGAADGRRGTWTDHQRPAVAVDCDPSGARNGLAMLGVSAPERM